MSSQNLTTDNFNSALQIAALAQFSKSCGLITDKDYNKLISQNAQAAYKNDFASQTSAIFNNGGKTDSDLFKKSGKNAFTDNLANLIYRTYFNLLQSNVEFQKTMGKVFFSFNSGLLDMQSLRLIILDNLSEDMELLVKRIESGEKISETEIVKVIKDALINKKEKIAEDAENATKATSTDGLSNYTPLSALAIKQRYKGIRWKPIKGGTLSPKFLKRLEKATKNIKSNLEKVRSGLKTARAIVGLLRKLESVFSLGYIKLIQSILKLLISYVRDIGSTGVYMLDMISPYHHIGYQMQIDKLKPKNEKDAAKMEKLKFLERIKRNRVASTYDYLNYDLEKATPFLSDMVEDEVKLGEFTKTLIDGKFGINNLINYINTKYRPTTYGAFIRVIADSFMDEGDIPGEAPINKLDNFSIKKTGRAKKNFNEGIIGTIPVVGSGANFLLERARPGRPVFGNGSNCTVTIVAFSLPDIFTVGTLTLSSAKSIIMLFAFFKQKWDDAEILQWVKDNDNGFYKKAKSILGFNISKNLEDYYQDQPYYDENGDIMLPSNISQDPDFYGVSLRWFLAPLFDNFDLLEGLISKWLKNFKSQLSKELDNLLDSIEELINDLEDLVDLIDLIVNFFETLKTMGLYTLTITSNGGNEDVVEKLLAAEGFPGVADGDKQRLIGGLVFCYGTPNTKPGNIDFQGLVKQQMAMMNYEASKAKYESDGNKEDDPGSFEDYVRDNNYGDNNYNSALDKIFKKLF